MFSIKYMIVRCQGDISIERGMGEPEIRGKAMTIGNRENIGEYDNQEDAMNAMRGLRNSLSYFTSNSTRYANAVMYWLVKETILVDDEDYFGDKEIEFTEVLSDQVTLMNYIN